MMAEKRKTTMGHITQDHLKQSKIVIPPMEYIERLDVKIMPILAKKVILEEESLRLTQLRDWLLPMLMNGQVTVTEAREMVEELMVAEPSVGYGKS
jgi:type I restriction enzyme S subunit